MEKQHIIRGAAILCMAGSATVFAAPHIFKSDSGDATKVDLSVLQERAALKSAGLAGASNPFEVVPDPGVIDSEAVETRAMTGPDTELLEMAEAQTVRIAALEDSSDPTAAVEASDSADAQIALGEDAMMERDCEATLTASATFDALIEVELVAPCHAESRFVISHDDLVVSAYLDTEGRFSTYFPALATTAKIDVFLADDTFISAKTEVEDADQFLRVMLQWTGEPQFGLHAYHDGARFGESGHVHAGQPFDPDLDEAFLISLGEMRGAESMLAQVYSLPLEMMDKSRLEVEAQFTQAQCGQDLLAFLSHSKGSHVSEMTEMKFAAPDCPASDGLMVMQVTLEEAHAAANPQGGLQLTGWQE